MPNRIIKETICTSDNLDRLTAFQETVFYRLIVNCDDYGRMDARARILASKLFPLKDIRAAQIDDALRALTSAELVTLYEVDGKPFLQMNTWDKHQQIRAKRSKYPAPEHGVIASDINCNHMISNDINCNHMIADDCICSRNPIQSEYNPREGENARTREDPFNLSSEEITESLSRDDRITQSAQAAGLPVSETALVKARNMAREYGLEKLIAAIEEASLSAQRPNWRYVEGVLEGRGSGGKQTEHKRDTGSDTKQDDYSWLTGVITV